MRLFETISSLFILFQSVFSTPLSLNSTHMVKYNQFIQDYNKEFSYEGFNNFRDNINYIEEFNKKNNTYVLDINKFADMNTFDSGIMDNYQSDSKIYELTNDIIPESVDWREKGAVTHVKDQGHCGGCWAFSTTGSIEGVAAIQTGNLFNLSEQQLIDCSFDEGNHGCEGGIMEMGFQYVINNNGSCSESDYPYQAMDGQCQECESVITISKYGNIFPRNERILKRAVAQQPVSVAIQANLTSFRFYSRGVYSDYNCGDKLDHGVLVVGYGTDEDSNLDYWLVKNSWGTSWGEDGYIRILRNAEETPAGICGITSQPCIPLL